MKRLATVFCAAALLGAAAFAQTAATAPDPTVTVQNVALSKGSCKVTLAAGKTRITIPGQVLSCTTTVGPVNCTVSMQMPPLQAGQYSIVFIGQSQIDYPVHSVSITLPVTPASK